MNKHITAAELAYAPRASVRDWLNNGWRLVPGMEYSCDDYAILMHKPAVCEDVSADAVLASLRRPVDPFPDMRRCEVEGCIASHHALGMCRWHYGQHYRRLNYASRRARERETA